MWRWLSAEPGDVVELAGARTLSGGGGDPHLGEELRRWRGIVARRRLVALLRRHAAVALAIAALFEILAQLGVLPQWPVVAVPVTFFVVSVTFFAARGPTPFGLARLLDDGLGLNDRLATALEIEARGGARNPLEGLTVGDAAALLRAGREDWHARTARGDRDWWALAVPIAALALVVGVGSLASSGGGSSSGPATALGPGAGPGGAAGSADARRHRREAREKRERDRTPASVLHKFKSAKGTEASAEQLAKSGYRQIPQGQAVKAKGGAKAGGEKGGSEKSPSERHLTEPAEGRPGANKGDRRPASKRQDKEKEHPTVGFNVKGQKNGGNGRPGATETHGPGATKKSEPNGRGDEATASPTESQSGKGTPAGGSKAGGEQGSESQGHATPIKGQASQAVKIQPGYAPSRSAKGGKERKRPGTQQGGGGKARTAQVTGATQVGDRFSFVPATGGSAPPAAAGLQQNYTESLKWVERLRW